MCGGGEFGPVILQESPRSPLHSAEGQNRVEDCSQHLREEGSYPFKSLVLEIRGSWKARGQS